MKRLLPTLQIATAAGILLFWALFYTVGLAPANPPPGYSEFESAFPLPDGLLALALVRAAALLRSPLVSRQRTGRSLSLACAGALVFLGVLDFSFNVQNGLYTTTAWDEALTAAAVQAWCLGFGLAMAWHCRFS